MMEVWEGCFCYHYYLVDRFKAVLQATVVPNREIALLCTILRKK